ncbi:MAG: dTDP-4-amino-4,6-dideoxygalactose transaminase [Bacteroidota bacterium]
MIQFNKPYLTGKEAHYLYEAVHSGKISGNGMFTQKCHKFFEGTFGFHKTLLTTSCTDALEMAAILLDIGPGDEVIMPSYTFVSTANAFVLRGADIIFADSYNDLPNIDPKSVESLITEKTKAIVVVHYAGIAVDMGAIMSLAEKHNLKIVEDAAQAIDSYYNDQPLGGIGHLAAFSFHETKNIISGEGGMLVINDPVYSERAEIIWEKGTNRAAFFRGEVDKYNWVDIGSSFLPSETVAAFLFAQLEELKNIQNRRVAIWEKYDNAFSSLQENEGILTPLIPDYATNNAHMYYLVLNHPEQRSAFIKHMNGNGVRAIFHYLSLHRSPFYEGRYIGSALPNSDHFTECLVRLPLFYELSEEQQNYVIDKVLSFFN